MKSAEALEYRKIRLESLMLFPESFSANYDEMKLKPKLLFEQYIEQEQVASFVMGAYDSENLIGIISFSDTNEYTLPNTGTFIQMYVKLEYQGKGIGLDLTKTALEQALAITDIRNVVLEVKMENMSAIVTYQRAGFSTYELPERPANGLLLMSYPAKLK